MTLSASKMRAEVAAFCAAIGSDPLLVQGAGGNVSWKDGDTLWIKASGTWLADAEKMEIFVPVHLAHLRAALAAKDFGVMPKAIGESPLRPSIETLLHALMPQPVVVHLHAVEILAYLVQSDFEAIFASLLGDEIRWVAVPYRKPGAALAQEVDCALKLKRGANVIFLQNHGVVIGGYDVAEVSRILHALNLRLTQPLQVPKEVTETKPLEMPPYLPIMDADIHRLALDELLFECLASRWVLYPDHVVFLGAEAVFYSNVAEWTDAMGALCDAPELVFLKNVGVYVKPGFSHAKLAQLRCYYEVLARQTDMKKLQSLSSNQIEELLDWDAEKYRIKIAK